MSKDILGQIKFLLEGLEQLEDQKEKVVTSKDITQEINELEKLEKTLNKKLEDCDIEKMIKSEVTRQISMYDLNSEVVHQAYILIWQMLESLDITLALKQVVRDKIKDDEKV